MLLPELMNSSNIILMEAAIVERLRRTNGIQLHPSLVNAPLIYDNQGRTALGEIYNEYIDIAEQHNLPIFLCTPTWRTDYDRVFASEHSLEINQDSVLFLQEIRSARGSFAGNIKIGGLIGCKNDCYLPDEALTRPNAIEYHKWQIDKLVKGGADFIIAETLPNIEEAIGIAEAISTFNNPYFISFVINRLGTILDGTPLINAIDRIDASVELPPIGYMVNCAHPFFLRAEQQPLKLYKRLCGYLANASSLDHCDLDSSETLMVDNLDEWSDEMLKIHINHGVKILGGCCGTNADHLSAVVEKIINIS